ncbi:MAG: molybdopterin molybdenumtransferase MoeA, partial [Calothrix sp. SM1_5_4]|nr:molybdopterin molybdenumtransferase MoeA [Calothrix sp. SM1_5_4]
MEDAVGRILAADMHARECNPPFDNSAMDGFALKVGRGDGPLPEEWLPVGGLLGAGDPVSDCDPGSDIIEIMTGAPIPPGGYDCVVRLEDVDVEFPEGGPKRIRLRRSPSVGDNIRRAGEDIGRGDKLLAQGTLLNARHLLILATQGIATVPVRRKLRCAIIPTGKEWSVIRRRVKFGQI